MARRTRKQFQYDYQGLDAPSLRDSMANHMIFTVGKDSYTATERDWFHALAYTVRDRLTERWMETMRSYYKADAKRVYYLSLEFLIGRTLNNSVLNLGFYEECREAVGDLGLAFDALRELEFDAALGNGGLGRLAACLLDSMATMQLPGYGYGIRYEYGMFRQGIEDGQQVEHPDNWLRYGNPWEFPRPEVLYPVKFYGRVVEYRDDQGALRYHWADAEDVMAMAYDTPVPGYGVDTVNNMRLWSAKATRDFDLQYFNRGNYIKAVEDKTSSENLSKVLYPADTTETGRTLRLKQQYFFVSASLQEILDRFCKDHADWDQLPHKVAIQLNDTHPAIAVAEMMRLLVDIHHLDWERAWQLTVGTFAYTNHTLLPEALETWPVALVERLLPRHMQIIYEINHRFLQQVIHRYPGDMERVQRMSFIDEGGERRVRMAHLALVGSHKVNGVAAIHTELLKSRVFRDFYEMYPERFVNITNGITPRRWLNQANFRLSQAITARLGDVHWKTDLERLRELVPLAEEPAFQEEFLAVKRHNKVELATRLAETCGVAVDPDSLFDIQIKRIHEYKRQLLNLLHAITLYNRLRHGHADGQQPRTLLFAGKAAPDYHTAKQVIRLINDAADIINNDPATGEALKIAFVPNYDVSTAAELIPAADLSEQISLAGTEASGTGNMKLALNGALTIGTRDGANIEIGEAVGEENIFFFGLEVEQVHALRERGYRPRDYYEGDAELREAIDMIDSGYFSPGELQRYRPLVANLLEHDPYMVLADYRSFVDRQRDVDRLFATPAQWARRAIINVAHMGRFSSDRTARDYAEKIWGVTPVRR